MMEHADRSAADVLGKFFKPTEDIRVNARTAISAPWELIHRGQKALRKLLWCRCGASPRPANWLTVKVLVRTVGLGGIEPPTSALSEQKRP